MDETVTKTLANSLLLMLTDRRVAWMDTVVDSGCARALGAAFELGILPQYGHGSWSRVVAFDHAMLANAATLLEPGGLAIHIEHISDHDSSPPEPPLGMVIADSVNTSDGFRLHLLHLAEARSDATTVNTRLVIYPAPGPQWKRTLDRLRHGLNLFGLVRYRKIRSWLGDLADIDRVIEPHRNFYCDQFGNQDPCVDLARHYLEVGTALGLSPAPEFSTRSYLLHNPDVAVSGLNPLLHYLRHGRKEGRSGATPPAADPISRSVPKRTFVRAWREPATADARLNEPVPATIAVVADCFPLSDGSDTLTASDLLADFAAVGLRPLAICAARRPHLAEIRAIHQAGIGLFGPDLLTHDLADRLALAGVTDVVIVDDADGASSERIAQSFRRCKVWKISLGDRTNMLTAGSVISGSDAAVPHRGRDVLIWCVARCSPGETLAAMANENGDAKRARHIFAGPAQHLLTIPEDVDHVLRVNMGLPLTSLLADACRVVIVGGMARQVEAYANALSIPVVRISDTTQVAGRAAAYEPVAQNSARRLRAFGLGAILIGAENRATTNSDRTREAAREPSDKPGAAESPLKSRQANR